MHSLSAKRLTTIEQAMHHGMHLHAAEAALTHYLKALQCPARVVTVGTTVRHALDLVVEHTRNHPITHDTLRDPRVRQAHAAAQQTSLPEGSVSRLAAARWKDARDAANAIARNIAWEATVVAWGESFHDERFRSGTRAQQLVTLVPTMAIDAQSFALEFVAWPEIAENRDESWPRLAEPLFDLFVAGVFRFWLLPDAVVLAPRTW